MSTLALQGKGPNGQLIVLRCDELGRLETVEAASGDQAKPTQPMSLDSIPAVTATVAATIGGGVKRAGGGTIATAAGTIYTATEARRNGKLILAPIASEAQVVNLWHVPAGQSRGDGYLIGRFVLAADALPIEIAGIGWASGDTFDAELVTGTTGKCCLTLYGETY